jgi:uncharacterized damage-inducible protein DinB
MTGNDILFQLWDYNRWANLRLMEKARELPPETLREKTSCLSRGSLMNTFIHMLETERAWRKMALERQKPEPLIDPGSPPDLEQLLGWWDTESREMQAYLNSLSDVRLGGSVPVRDREGNEYPMVIWQMLMQAFLHSMQHRSEAAACLTELGHSPGDLDFIFFV